MTITAANARKEKQEYENYEEKVIWYPAQPGTGVGDDAGNEREGAGGRR